MTRLIHGGFSLDSCFNIRQVDYVAAEMSYIEALVIKDRCVDHFVVVKCVVISREEFSFIECTSENTLRAVFDRWVACESLGLVPFFKPDGFIRMVKCDTKVPWFYAQEGDLIEGDVVVPSKPQKTLW